MLWASVEASDNANILSVNGSMDLSKNHGILKGNVKDQEKTERFLQLHNNQHLQHLSF